jgi:hypothetical protein
MLTTSSVRRLLKVILRAAGGFLRMLKMVVQRDRSDARIKLATVFSILLRRCGAAVYR